MVPFPTWARSAVALAAAACVALVTYFSNSNLVTKTTTPSPQLAQNNISSATTDDSAQPAHYAFAYDPKADLQTTLNREMENLERETGVRELTNTNYLADSYNYEFTGDDSGEYYSEPHALDTTTYEASASATEGVEHIAGPLQIEAAADSVPNGHVYDAGSAEAVHAEALEPPTSVHSEAGHDPVHS